MENRIRISSKRRHVVINEISAGSLPEMRFYIMVAISTLIASFGLITNSTAVVIGAMLVAPLMTPIFGIALALIRSDSNLFGEAIKAEIVGVVAAVAMSMILGWLYPHLDPTPEMIARTEPQLFDLFVAIFAGFAGAYALLDEKISPALPGVAIATAIVPPLANTGLCFSVGQYAAGIGSFVLFFANFLSILLVAAATFWFFGMTDIVEGVEKRKILRRFSFPLVCFVLVATFLTYTLIRIAYHNHLHESIVNTLKTELLEYPDSELDSSKYDEKNGVVYVLAKIHSSKIMSPTQVDKLEKSLQRVIGRETELIVRSTIAMDISAFDSKLELVEQKLDGSFTKESVNPRVRYAKAADTLIRNYLEGIAGYALNNVRYLEIGNRPTLFATIYGIATPHPNAVEDLQQRLREELNLPDVHLLISFIKSQLYDSSGAVRLEFSGLLPNYTTEEGASVSTAIDLIREELTSIEWLSITGLNYNMFDNVLYVLVDANYPGKLSVEQIKSLEKMVADKTSMSIKLFVNMQDSTVVSSSGYEPYWSVSRKGFKRHMTTTRDEVKRIIEASKM